VSAELTKITEIVTGLGTLPTFDLDEGFAALLPPTQLHGVDLDVWQELQASLSNPELRTTFETAFENQD